MNSSEAKKVQAAHTPGPWKIDKKGVFIRVEDERELPIARIDKRALDKRETANARLIAAAPEMLEMLYELNDMIEGGSPQIEALIKKAGGTFE